MILPPRPAAPSRPTRRSASSPPAPSDRGARAISFHLRFFFEYGVDTPVWPGPSDAPDLDSPYGYPCAPRDLPVTAATATELVRLAALYQSSLDRHDPAGPSPWSAERWESFGREADAALGALRRDLGDGWTVEDRRR
ncbi:hypothetical protein [Streptomyces sp. NPDC048606]|uniref:hypothetical protein n=1 Tax=Streptomyces sp. NPDC048606 TaxID=3154726 RepID=UPI0034348E0B